MSSTMTQESAPQVSAQASSRPQPRSEQQMPTEESVSAVDVRGLTVRIPTRLGRRGAWVHACTDVALAVRAGSVHALVGESGCGKSVLASTLVGLLPGGTQASGSVRLGDVDLSAALERPADPRWRGIRGRVVGFVPQSSATFLTPHRTVRRQLRETCRALAASATPAELFDRVGLPERALDLFPHELSGGMAGRAAVAFALAGDPAVLVADEPTASLDPDLTRHVLDLLRACADAGTAVLLITHDLAALDRAGIADDLSVMYAGRIVESGPAATLFEHPVHAYTRALLRALPENGLHPIPGMPPSLTDLDPRVRFEDRLREGSS